MPGSRGQAHNDVVRGSIVEFQWSFRGGPHKGQHFPAVTGRVKGPDFWDDKKWVVQVYTPAELKGETLKPFKAACTWIGGKQGMGGDREPNAPDPFDGVEQVKIHWLAGRKTGKCTAMVRGKPCGKKTTVAHDQPLLCARHQTTLRD